MAKMIRFCIDFTLPVPKLNVTQIFKKVSPNNHDITYEQFKEMIEKLFVEVARLKGQELKRKLKNS